MERVLRINEVMLVGQIASDLVRLSDDTLHFLLSVDLDTAPVHCFCEGVTADNLEKYCKKGDEICCEGRLRAYQFDGSPRPDLLVQVRFVSFGRKLDSARA